MGMNIGQTLGTQTFGEVDYVNASNTAVASTTTISPTGDVVRITGTTAIQTINLPVPNFVGPLYIYETDSSVASLGTSGNIALGVTLTRYKVFTLIYDSGTSKWYPSATS
jgi:hypothetical protein